MSQARAAKGGQTGANGEWYEGGKFIATTDHAKSHKPARKGTGRVEYEPFKWATAPDGQFPIMKYSTFINLRACTLADEQVLSYYQVTASERAGLAVLLDMWKRGERWADNGLDPFGKASE